MLSRFSYKEIKELEIDASPTTVGVLTLAYIGSKIGVSRPTLAPTIEDATKFGTYVAGADLKNFLILEKLDNEFWC